MTESLRRELNPTTITVDVARCLPSTPVSHEELRKRWEGQGTTVDLHLRTCTVIPAILIPLSITAACLNVNCAVLQASTVSVHIMLDVLE